MGKLLSIALLIGLALLVFRFLGRKRVRQDETSESPRRAEDMVRCHVCGVNMPRSEAIMSRGRFYCGPEHRSQDQA